MNRSRYVVLCASLLACSVPSAAPDAPAGSGLPTLWTLADPSSAQPPLAAAATVTVRGCLYDPAAPSACVERDLGSADEQICVLTGLRGVLQGYRTVADGVTGRQVGVSIASGASLFVSTAHRWVLSVVGPDFSVTENGTVYRQSAFEATASCVASSALGSPHVAIVQAGIDTSQALPLGQTCVLSTVQTYADGPQGVRIVGAELQTDNAPFAGLWTSATCFAGLDARDGASAAVCGIDALTGDAHGVTTRARCLP